MVDTLLGIQVFNCQPYLTTSVLLRFEVSSTLLYPVYCLKQYSKTAMNKQFGTDLSQLVCSQRIPGLNP